MLFNAIVFQVGPKLLMKFIVDYNLMK